MCHGIIEKNHIELCCYKSTGNVEKAVLFVFVKLNGKVMTKQNPNGKVRSFCKNKFQCFSLCESPISASCFSLKTTCTCLYHNALGVVPPGMAKRSFTSVVAW